MSRPRFTYSGVVSTLALVFALSGGAYAATALPKNSVGAKQIKRNAVESAKIKAGAVNATKLAPGAVDGTKLAPGAVDAGKLAANAVDGTKIIDGSLTGADIKADSLGTVKQALASIAASSATHAGSSAALDKTVYRTASGSSSGPVATATATCDPGMKVLGGGVKVANIEIGNIGDSYPEGTGAWTGRVWTADGSGTTSFTVYAICAPVGTTG